MTFDLTKLDKNTELTSEFDLDFSEVSDSSYDVKAYSGSSGNSAPMLYLKGKPEDLANEPFRMEIAQRHGEEDYENLYRASLDSRPVIKGKIVPKTNLTMAVTSSMTSKGQAFYETLSADEFGQVTSLLCTALGAGMDQEFQKKLDGMKCTSVDLYSQMKLLSEKLSSEDFKKNLAAFESKIIFEGAVAKKPVKYSLSQIQSKFKDSVKDQLEQKEMESDPKKRYMFFLNGYGKMPLFPYGDLPFNGKPIGYKDIYIDGKLVKGCSDKLNFFISIPTLRFETAEDLVSEVNGEVRVVQAGTELRLHSYKSTNAAVTWSWLNKKAQELAGATWNDRLSDKISRLRKDLGIKLIVKEVFMPGLITEIFDELVEENGEVNVKITGQVNSKGAIYSTWNLV